MRLAIITLMLTFNVACGGTIDPSTPDSKYVEYAKDFECILKICGKDEKDRSYCASAVAVAPHWIMTAAHVVKDVKSSFVVVNHKVFEVKKIVCHDQYEEKNYGTCDLALGYIEEDLGLKFYPEIYKNQDEVGKICSISGYGITGTFNTGAKNSDNQRRAGSNKVESIDRKLLVCTPSKENRTSLEFLIAHGDSGGGLFIDGKLAGINSCVMATDKKPDSTYGDESGHTRLSLYKDWIKEVMQK